MMNYRAYRLHWAWLQGDNEPESDPEDEEISDNISSAVGSSPGGAPAHVVERELGYDPIGQGGFRDAFRIDDQRVLKANNDMPQTINATAREIKVWERAPEWLRELLVPLRIWDDSRLWVIQDYAADYSGPVSLVERNLHGAIQDRDFFVDDFKQVNVGMHEGKAKVRDYGNGVHPVTRTLKYNP